MAVDFRTNPGVFNKNIVLLKEHVTFDELGAPKSVWHPFLKLTAAIEPLAGRDYWNASQSQSEENVRVTIRFRRDIPSRLRIMYQDLEAPVTLELKSPPINYNQSNEYLELMCRRYSEQESEGNSEGGIIIGGGSE